MTTRTSKIIYITNNLNELRLQSRKEILQIIINSYSISDEKIIEKGNGTEILYKYISDDLLDKIYKYIKQKLDQSDLVLNLL